jgi:hypothetical protein
MEKTYYLNKENKQRYLRFVITTIIVGVAGMYFILWFSEVIVQHPVIAIFPVSAGVYSVVYMFNYYDKKHININDTGVEYNSARVVFQAEWQDLEKISFGWHEQIKQEGIVVDKLRLKTKNSFQELPSKEFFLANSTKVFIPLSCFSETCRDSELGLQIKQYAPHLFQ